MLCYLLTVVVNNQGDLFPMSYIIASCYACIIFIIIVIFVGVCLVSFHRLVVMFLNVSILIGTEHTLTNFFGCCAILGAQR